MFVVPAKGLIVRDPRTRQPLPEGGKEVPDDFYWVRRLRDGDVTLGTAPTAAVASLPAKSTVAQGADK